MPDIFLSYKREDARAAAKLAKGLRDVGFDVWWDVDIPAGAPWEATIERALVDAKIVLVCWSDAAVASDNVRSEARWAREQGRLIQLFVEPCNPPLFFGERQGIDISNWSGDGADARFQRLVSQLRARLEELAGNGAPLGALTDSSSGKISEPVTTDIARWLRSLDLDRYAPAFDAAEVNLETLHQLDDADLKEIGIPMGPRRRILAALAGETTELVPDKSASAGPTEAPPVTAAERRQITVMSVALVGVRRLSMEVDPELLADVLATYKDRVVRVIKASGGWFPASIDDGVIAYFGWPQAQEDAAENAIRSGFQVIAEVGRLDGPDGRPLQCRVGIATGLVVVGQGEGKAHKVSITGEAPNLAVGLQHVASPGTVVISEATRRLVEQLFACEDLREQPVDGFATSVQAWRALRELPHLSRFTAKRAVRTSFVGRVHELSLLADRWKTASEGMGRTVVVLGEAGMGKSRLADALHNQVIADPHHFITVQCSPYHQTKALYPFVEHLMTAAGTIDADSPAERLAKIKTLLTSVQMPLDGSLTLFARLLGVLPEAGFVTPSLSPNQIRSATIAALIGWLQRIAAVKPLLFLFEDAHWADATTLELLAALVGSAHDIPLLTIITARPEFLSPWSGRAEVSTIGLDRLTKRDCETLAREVTGPTGLQDRMVEEIVSRSDGNPLFVEELSAAVSCGATSSIKAVPDTLQGSLMARLDGLGGAKRTAQVCSVLGRRFARPLLMQVAPLAPALLDANLALLVERDVIRPIGGAGEDRYEFKHALVRDAAYESMLLAERRRLHETCGRLLERLFPDVVRTEPELLAQHFGLAGAAQEASAYAEQAGDLATAACAFHEAIANYDEALRQTELLTEGPARDRRTLSLLLKLGPAIGMIRGAQDPGLRAIYQRAELLSRSVGDGDALFKAVWGLWYNANISRELDHASAFAERLVDIGKRSGDEDLALEALHCRWSSAMFRGDYVRCVTDSQHGTKLYDRHRHHKLGLIFGGHDPGVCAFGCRGQALVCIGDVEAGFASAEEAIALAEALQHPGSLAHGLMMSMITSTVARAPTLLRAYAERMIELDHKVNLPPQRAMANYHLAWIEAEIGDRATGLDAMGRLYDRVTAIGPLTLLYKAMYVDQLLRAGRAHEALALADQAVKDLRFPNVGHVLSELLRLRGDCLATLGRSDEAVSDLIRAEAMAQRDGAGLLRLRAATSLYDKGGEGQRQVLEAALEAFPSGWCGPDVVTARTLLHGH